MFTFTYNFCQKRLMHFLTFLNRIYWLLRTFLIKSQLSFWCTSCMIMENCLQGSSMSELPALPQNASRLLGFFTSSHLFFLIVYLSPPLLSSCQSAVTLYCCQWACLYCTPILMVLICCQLKNQIIKTSEITFTISGVLGTGWRFWDLSSSSFSVFTSRQ